MHKVLGCVDEVVSPYEHGPDNMVNSIALKLNMLAMDNKCMSWQSVRSTSILIV